MKARGRLRGPASLEEIRFRFGVEGDVQLLAPRTQLVLPQCSDGVRMTRTSARAVTNIIVNSETSANAVRISAVHQA
jgi:hypothetical protein